MKLVRLAEFLEHLLGAVDVITVGVLVVVAEDADQRCGQLVGEVNGRDRPLGVEQLGVADHHVAAPAVHHRIDASHAAAREIGMAPTRAEPDHADLAGRVGLCPQIGDGAGHVAHHLGIRHATCGPHPRPDVVGIARTLPEIEVRRNRRIAMMGELARHLDDPLVPAGQMHDHHDAGHLAGACRPRVIGLAGIPVVALERHDLCLQTFIRHCCSTPLVVAGMIG